MAQNIIRKGETKTITLTSSGNVTGLSLTSASFGVLAGGGQPWILYKVGVANVLTEVARYSTPNGWTVSIDPTITPYGDDVNVKLSITAPSDAEETQYVIKGEGGINYNNNIPGFFAYLTDTAKPNTEYRFFPIGSLEVVGPCSNLFIKSILLNGATRLTTEVLSTSSTLPGGQTTEATVRIRPRFDVYQFITIDSASSGGAGFPQSLAKNLTFTINWGDGTTEDVSGISVSDGGSGYMDPMLPIDHTYNTPGIFSPFIVANVTGCPGIVNEQNQVATQTAQSVTVYGEKYLCSNCEQKVLTVSPNGYDTQEECVTGCSGSGNPCDFDYGFGYELAKTINGQLIQLPYLALHVELLEGEGWIPSVSYSIDNVQQATPTLEYNPEEDEIGKHWIVNLPKIDGDYRFVYTWTKTGCETFTSGEHFHRIACNEGPELTVTIPEGNDGGGGEECIQTYKVMQGDCLVAELTTDNTLTLEEGLEWQVIKTGNSEVISSSDLPLEWRLVPLSGGSTVILCCPVESILASDYQLKYKSSNGTKFKVNFEVVERVVDSPNSAVPAPVLISKTNNLIKVKLPKLPDNAEGLSLWYGTNSQGPWTKYLGDDTRLAGNTEVILEELNSDTTYYLLTAAYSGVNVTLSDFISVKTFKDAPIFVPAPEVALSQEDVTKVTVTWFDDENPLPEDIESLFLWFSLDGNTFTRIDKELISEDSHELASLTPNSVYYLKLVGTNDGEMDTSSVVVQFTTLKLAPGLPGVVIFDDVMSTRLIVLRTFPLPDRADKVTLYLVQQNGTRIRIHDFESPEEDKINVYELTPDTNHLFQFSASNNGGEVFGPLAGVKTNVTEDKLPPLKPAVPIIDDDVINIYSGSNFIHHLLAVQSPLWDTSLSYPVEGMELWCKIDESSYSRVLSFTESELNYYHNSAQITVFNAQRCKTYTFKVRAFNIQNGTYQYSEFSDEAEKDLNSTTCTVKITKPTESDNVFFKTYIEFEVKDSSGHSNEEVFVRGQPVSI